MFWSYSYSFKYCFPALGYAKKTFNSPFQQNFPFQAHNFLARWLYCVLFEMGEVEIDKV